MAFLAFRNKKNKISFILFVSLLISLSSLITGAFLFSSSRLKRVQNVLDRTLSGASVTTREIMGLGRVSKKSFETVFSEYERPELLAASLLLENQGYSNFADFLLSQVSDVADPLGGMARSILVESLEKKKKWQELSEFSSVFVSNEEDGQEWLNRALMAVYRSQGAADNFFQTVDADVLWAVPFLEDSGDLSKEKLVTILLSASAGEIYDFLNIWKSPLKEDQDIQNLLILKNAMEQREYDRAEPLMRELWQNVFSDLESLPESFLLSLRDMLKQSRYASSWLKVFEQNQQRNLSYGDAFLLGSLRESTGDIQGALASYRAARDSGASFEKTRRAQWYEMRLIVRNSPQSIPSFLADNARKWGSTSYFDDLIDEYFTYLVGRKDWTHLAETVEILGNTDLRQPVAQGAFLLNQAVVDGRISRPSFFTDSLFRESLERDRLGYYSLVTFPGVWPIFEEEQDSSFSIGLEADEKAIEKVYRIILEAGQIELGWSLWNRRRDPLSPYVVDMFSSRLFKMGEFFRCIQFSGYWYYRWPSGLAVHLIPWLYPQDRTLPVDRYALKQGIPGELILGIIRRESAFHQTIESYSGAVGLMQLMPSTATDLAGRYRMEGWSLTDPGDNIRLGSLYINWLKERPWTSCYAEILAAYNGGGGNLRRWKRSFGDLGIQLFIQAIPYSETRNYVRKVIVAAGTYRYLNTGNPPSEWLDLFFQPFEVK